MGLARASERAAERKDDKGRGSRGRIAAGVFIKVDHPRPRNYVRKKRTQGASVIKGRSSARAHN